MVQERMVFRNRALRLRPVNSVKHIVDIQGGLVGGTQTAATLIESVDNPILSEPTDCATASNVRSIFLNVQVAATGTAALANVYFYIAKNQSNQIATTAFPNGNVVGSSDLKKLVIHQEMLMTEKNTTAIARTMFRGVILIPRHMQRNGQDDELQIFLFSPGVNFDFCVQCIYKEFR